MLMHCYKQSQSWLLMHPEWTYFFWTDSDNLRLIQDHYPDHLRLYNGYSAWASHLQRADVIRYFILHRYGGVYVDLDFESLRPLDVLLKVRILFVCFDPLNA